MRVILPPFSRSDAGALHLVGLFFVALVMCVAGLVVYQVREIQQLRFDVEVLKAHIAVLEARPSN